MWPQPRPPTRTENLPAAQSTQADSFALEKVARYLPAAQSTHALLPPVAAYWPGRHGSQADSFVLPSVARYLPAAQALQALWPALEYAPAAQALQALWPALECVPAAQAPQVLFDAAPVAAEDVPAAQATQVLFDAAPVAAEDVPAAQEMQVLWPALEYVPAAQEMQVSAVVAPSCEEYFPALQSTHSFFVNSFIAARYLPVAHVGHKQGEIPQSASAAQEKQHLVQTPSYLHHPANCPPAAYVRHVER
jgi:hypothetical protein